MFVPGGWANDAKGDGFVLFLVERQSGENFSVTVINLGEGVAEYHPISGNSATDVKYKLAVEFKDIPSDRICDSAFWFFALRLIVSKLLIYVFVYCWI